ncbi:MAG: EAL domain-containing protein [Woeseiaceae bacterium]
MKQRTAVWPLLLALCVCLNPAQLLAADGSVEAPFRFYTVRDGLTQSQVNHIEQDRAGYLWFTTARGLNRFDGKEFTHYTIADGLPHNTLTAIHIGDSDSIWVGDTRGNISEIQAGRVARSIEIPLFENKAITDIDMIGQRMLVVVENLGIVEITSDAENTEAKLLGGGNAGITGLFVYGTDVWLESETGLYELTFGTDTRLTPKAPSLRRIGLDNSGTLWAIDEHNRLGTFGEDGFDVVAEVKTEQSALSLEVDNQGRVWIATNDELFRFDSENQQANPDLKSYSGIDQVTSLFVDNENSLWLASGTALVRFLGDRFRHYPLRTSVDPETVWSIAEDSRGRFWFGTQSKLLLREHDESIVVVGADYGIPAGAVRDVVASPDGSLWLGVREFGLFRVDSESRTGQHIEASGKADILDIDVSADGSVWYSTLQTGVFRYSPSDGQLQRFETPQGTSSYTIDAAADGSVWYGADDVGLVKLVPDSAGRFNQEIIDSPDLHNMLFDQVQVTGPESAWIATEEGGIFEYKDGDFRDFGAGTDIADQTVYFVEPLPNGSVVVGGEQGVYQFIPGQPGFAYYNGQLGFVGLETNVHATLLDSDGFLWIGTVDGASRMDTEKPMPQELRPTPAIIRVETELDRHPILDGREIEPTQLGAHVEFAAISLLSPRGVEYSYKLHGVDDAWGPSTPNRSASYPRIPPGDYEFMVRARYSDGEWSQEFASYRFTVLPFFWQQAWFMFAVVLIVLLGFRAAMIYRTRKIEWTNNTLRAQVEERTRSIELARQRLEDSNEELSKLVEARSELEARFRRAFENAPIGMGLLNAKGILFDANPALKNMFWPDADTAPEVLFFDKIVADDVTEFHTKFFKLVAFELENLDQKLTCKGADGEEIQTVVNISTVKSDAGEFLYAVLQIQDVTESLKLTSQLEYQASYDELTGLLNRRAFEARLEQVWENAADRPMPSHLMFMDLDQFKVVNDTSGHSAGDQLLRAVSEILRESVRGDDVIARLGGDEFGIVLLDCPTEVAKRIAESIRSAIELYRFHFESEVYRIGISIGVIPVDHSIGDISELQQLADAACYAAKEAGRNRVHMVAGEKDSARDRRGQVRWVQRLREAMDNNRFAIYAQVIQPLDETIDEPEHQEILLRLRDPETRRLIPPGAFLPAAERYGLSVELDQWVVESLLHALFIHQSFHAEDRKYWINLSGASIGDKRFAGFLMEAIKNSPLPPGTINFEITETAVIRSVAEAGTLMASLRDMGCKFSLDDFGSGLSSFGYLKKLPVDYLKIDGMFIRDLLTDKTDRIFVKSIIDIAHTLNIKTVAEFIENDELLKVARELGADYAQGFAVGRPFVLAPHFPRAESSNSELTDIQTKAG